nr:SOS response-associated peptidase family protein [Thalassotalea atypica]
MSQLVSDYLGIEFNAIDNDDLRPSEAVATIIKPPLGFAQINANWGIKPDWSKQLLINAKAETITEKPTFKSAFSHSRCLVPCSGWYEWKTEENNKIKYQFTAEAKQPLYMGGILYHPESPQLVTLTTSPTKLCAEIHHRMPVLVTATQIEQWFDGSQQELEPLLTSNENCEITIKRMV